MPEEPFELTPELLDDFYAECDEQLAAIRARLAELNGGLATAEATAAALDAVYRSLHSFKGNAAIVGLAGAEGLAHAAETILRRLTRRETELDGGLLHLLEQVTHRLDGTVAAFRAQQPLPPVEDLLDSLASHAAAPPAEATPGETVPPPPIVRPDPPSLPPSGTSTVTATFQPSPELDQRGINLASVRERLASLGHITGARPSVLPGGKVSFHFTVALPAAGAELPDWSGDGLLWSGVTVGAASAAPEGHASAVAAPASHIVRVDLTRLDELMRIAGEMVILRSRLHERLARVAGDTAGLQEVNHGLARALRHLRTAIMRVRLVPVREIFSRIPFVVRDLTRDTDKSVRLVVEGEETEIDKYMVERLREPLLHLVRNAISHGVEPSDERRRRGKAPEATLRLRASTMGDAVQLEIFDDGRGIDGDQVARRAREAGQAVPEQPTSADLLRLISTPGLSTRDSADRTAGRGLGMAVVENTLRELGGTVALQTEPGRFTHFTLRLPLSLSIADTFIVEAGDQLCAIPQGQTLEVVQVHPADIRTLNEVEVVPHRGGLLPVLRLRRLFRLGDGDRPEVVLVVLATDHGPRGLAVDRVLGQREVVVRPFRDPLLRVPGFAGATELGDGRPVLILDALTVRQAVARIRSGASPHVTPESKAS